MAAPPSEAEVLVGELESRVDRLRSLYDQYFCGLEKIEPMVPKKDVERRIVALRKANLRNTALRFRFSTAVQRYNTYQAHWQRICRQIEEGTYKRDVRRAQERFGNVSGLRGMRGLRRGDASTIELDDLDFEEDIDLEEFRQPVDSLSDELDTLRPDKPDGGQEVPVVTIPKAAPPPRFVLNKELHHQALKKAAAQDVPPSAPQPAPASASRPRSIPPALPARAQPQLQARAANAGDDRHDAHDPYARPEPARPELRRPDLRPVRPVAVDTSSDDPYARPAPPPPMPREAGTGTRPIPLPFAPLTQPGAVRANLFGPGMPTTRDVARAQPHAPPPPRAGEVTPAPSSRLAPASAARPMSPPSSSAMRSGVPRGDLSDERVRQLYSQYVDAKRSRQESTATITFDGLAKSLRDSSAKLKEKHGDKAVDFEVTVKDGKTILRPVVK